MDTKERLVVSNGSKRIETEDNGQWTAYRVQDKGNLQNGVYPLHEAKSIKPDSKGQHVGTIIHVDKNSVYQDQGDKGIAKFDRHAFSKAPEIGRAATINYEYGRTTVNEYKFEPGTAAAIASVEKRAQADGLSAEQRAIVVARVQQNALNSIERGHAPSVKIKSETEVKQERTQEQGQSR